MLLRTRSRQLKTSKLNKNRTHLSLELLEDRTVPTLLGQDLFPADNPWNQKISDAPVAANSDAVMANITSVYGNGRLHPDFGQDYHTSQDLYGIPFNVVHGNSMPHQTVVIDDYADESDLVATPIPSGVVLEGDLQNAPRVGVSNRGDSHMLIWDVDNDIAYEFYHASRPSENADGKWHAAQESVWDMKTNAFRTLGWTSADAAGLSILAGLVRPDEALPVSEGGQGIVTHAIRFTLQNAVILNQFIYPASHTANPGNTNTAIMPPMGARFRLKASVDISQLNPESRIIAQAMKDYGLIVADNGSNFFFQGASSSVDASNHLTLTWNDNDIQDTLHGLKSLHYGDFEVVDLKPVVTSLDVSQGAAGDTVTITGKNFGGAAGHLQVFFGAAPATSVTYVDANHLQATVPDGTGTVDVRVRIGVATSNTSNYTGAIFGYGTSATSAADQFTFGTTPPPPPPPPPPSNAAPTVAVAASATPSTILTGKTSTLSVLGSDDGGEANLKYTWSVVSKPNGAVTPTFSANGTNAAKTTVATFFKAGTYVFRATIADAGGLTVTSDVTVSVVKKLTSLRVSPAIATVLVNQSIQFKATAYDQFGYLMAQQPIFTWKVWGYGRVTSTGLYTAPSRRGGPYLVRAYAGGLYATAKVTVVTALLTAAK